MRRFPTALLADALCVLVFAAVGRRSHAEGVTIPGVLETAWPFLAGLAAGWLVLLAAGRAAQAAAPAAALVLWPATVAVGMGLRALTGQGTALAFVIVATLFTGATLAGWRVGARALSR